MEQIGTGGLFVVVAFLVWFLSRGLLRTQLGWNRHRRSWRALGNARRHVGHTWRAAWRLTFRVVGWVVISGFVAVVLWQAYTKY